MSITCFGFLIFFSCQLPEPPAADAARFCRVAKPMCWSQNDTRYSKEQMDAHNRVGRQICGWKDVCK